MASNIIKIDHKLLSVGILGFTGESGKALTKEILKNNFFKSVSLIGRRNVKYDEEFYKNGTQLVVDFDEITKYDDVFKQDVIYCCLGTTRGKSGADGFRKVDFDYIVESAKMAKKNGCKQFHLISSAGADKNSMLLYPQVKGEAEEAISNLGFEKLFIYRPKMLLVDREEKRLGERIALTLTKPFQIFAPTLITTPIDVLAKSLISKTIFSSSEITNNIEILDNNDIFKLAQTYDKHK